MIICEQVSKKYGKGMSAIQNVTFEMERGEMAFLTGHSGAGKSTLLKLLTAIERPTSGKIIVGSTKLSGIAERDIAAFRQSIGVVFQNHLLLPDKNVFDNVALPLKVCGFGRKEIVKRVHAALDTVKLLDRAFEMPAVLSGGEQQRVGIARAVVNRPTVLFADEPTGNLDFALGLEIMRLFERFHDVGVTVLVATHNSALIECHPHRILRLASGQLVNAREYAE
ncbi:MAG: cell division ATP-binding protein FtsE [Gammaproteobacteria bacterium]